MFNLSLPGDTLPFLFSPFCWDSTSHLLLCPPTSFQGEDIPFAEQLTVLEVEGLSNYSFRGKPGGMMNL